MNIRTLHEELRFKNSFRDERIEFNIYDDPSLEILADKLDEMIKALNKVIVLSERCQHE